MNPYTSLQNYIISKKTISSYYIFLGIFLLLISAICRFYNYNDSLFQGLFFGSLTFGILIILIGITYRNFNTKIFLSVENDYLNDRAIFLNKETLRMEKVLDNFSSFQTIFTIIIILAIGVIISFKIPYISGVCIIISLLFSGILIIEAISKSSIDQYYQELQKAHSSNFILEGLD